VPVVAVALLVVVLTDAVIMTVALKLAGVSSTGVLRHPRDSCSQHHRFIRADQALSQLAYPTLQSNGLWGDVLHSMSRFSQHQLCFLTVHDSAAPSLQSNSGDAAVVDAPVGCPVVVDVALHPRLSW